MSRTVYTFNTYHLGDNLIFLHLLRHLAKQNPSIPFVHFCHGLDQLAEVVADIENIYLSDFESPLWGQHKHEAVDTWKNAEGFWETSPHRWDWSLSTLSHHMWTSERMGFMCPFICREHLLFDYPCINASKPGEGYDFLIGNSAPNSGQYSEWADHSKKPMDELIAKLRENWYVITTEECKADGKSISDIGGISQSARNHIMVPNGPFWPTMNTTNHHHHEGRKRIVLLDNNENLNMPHILQMRNVAEVMEFAKQEGWL